MCMVLLWLTMWFGSEVSSSHFAISLLLLIYLESEVNIAVDAFHKTV